jgi:NAD(P)-dependent dehydrogenase (short-subunit alcohol dehydrogenase family)
MLLKSKVAVVYGAGGNIGGAVARAFAADGARVFLVGRTRSKVEKTAADIAAAGGMAEVVELDASDDAAVERHLDEVVSKAGRIDISMNACSTPGVVMGSYLRDMNIMDFVNPVAGQAKLHFTTARAAASRMAKAKSGVILLLSTSSTSLSGRDRMWHKPGGFGAACAVVEELSRGLAGELGPLGVRVVCLKPDAISETWAPEHRAEWSEAKQYMDGATVMGSLPTLRQVADAAVWAASDRSAAMTGAILNLTRGSVMSAS